MIIFVTMNLQITSVNDILMAIVAVMLIRVVEIIMFVN